MEAEKFLLGALRDRRYRVEIPIPCEVWISNGVTIVEAADLCEFGCGGNRSEAIADLQSTVVELYDTLLEKQDQLGADLEGVWERLQHHVRRVYP